MVNTAQLVTRHEHGKVVGVALDFEEWIRRADCHVEAIALVILDDGVSKEAEATDDVSVSSLTLRRNSKRRFRLRT